MPHKTKKKFIDKKKAVTFQLVHRSQKDPLAADDEAPQRVLLPLGESIENTFEDETPREREIRLSKQRMYGVAFDDDYDYMQHLREPEKQQSILVPKSSRVMFNDLPMEEDSMDDLEEMTEVLMDGGSSSAIKLPTVVFASKEEEDVGMLHRAIPPVGPQVDWDPDIVAAMDEDFNLEDPQNLLEDDFISKASAETGNMHYGEKYEKDSDEEEAFGSECSFGSDVPTWEGDGDFPEEETRSRFTQYSMSSSVIPRNEHLTLLDDKFEKFYETYDDEKIGDLGQVEIDGAVPVDCIEQQDALKMLLGIKEEENVLDKEVEKRRIERLQEEEEVDRSSEEEKDEYLVELVREEPREKWDCESILSTYSNIYNHPKLIEDPPKPIKLSKKTGIPLDTLPTRGLTKKQLRMLDEENADCDETNRLHTTSECSQYTVTNVRRKDETKEEKTARKQVVKEMRRERRAEKKATKLAFRVEKTRQHKEMINLQTNLNGIKIS